MLDTNYAQRKMGNLATGVDLIDIERMQSVIERHGDHFLNRVFTLRELAEVGEKTQSLAARFAAKEAVTKALGTGIGRVTWHDIEILHNDIGAPELHLHGLARTLANELNLDTWSLSLSHTQKQAVAVVVAIGSE